MGQARYAKTLNYSESYVTKGSFDLHLLYICYLGTFGEKSKTSINRGFHGGPCWIRTNDPLIKSQMLYQLS